MDIKNKEIFNCLNKIITNPKCELNFKNNYELLVAVCLSAQCTDKRVNQTTPKLFEKYPTVYDLANASLSDIMSIIKPCGCYKNKAQNLKLACTDIVKKFNGQVPDNLEDLMTLRGVGRKTANVVLAEAFSKPTIAVDTHVFRVANRLGLANSKTVDGVEKALMAGFDQKDWVKLHHTLILFGRYYCKAKNPQCENCELKKYCKYYKEK